MLKGKNNGRRKRCSDGVPQSSDGVPPLGVTPQCSDGVSPLNGNDGVPQSSDGVPPLNGNDGVPPLNGNDGVPPAAEFVPPGVPQSSDGVPPLNGNDGVPPAAWEVPPGVPPAAEEVPPGVPPAAWEVPPGVPPSHQPHEVRHNRNRLQANIVSVASGKTAPTLERSEDATVPPSGFSPNLDKGIEKWEKYHIDSGS